MICIRIGIDLKKHFLSLKKEVFRKSIHICTAFVPVFIHFYRIPTLVCLALAGLLYTVSEFLRLKGITVPLVSSVTMAAARSRDDNKFVLGPVTLVAGVILTSLLWKEPFSAVGIFALAFGDGLASLAGKTFGRIEVPLTGGKTAAGSLTCFAAVFISSFFVLRSCVLSFFLAFAATLIEGLPLKDYDNVFIPVVTGGIAQIFFENFSCYLHM